MRTKSLFFIILLVGLAGAGAWYFLYSQIIAAATAVAAASVQSQSASAVTQQDRSLAAFLVTSSSTASTLLGAVVPAEGSVAFINMIEHLAKTAKVGLRVQSVGVSVPNAVAPNASPNTFDALNLSLSVQGSWNALYTFLKMLQTLPYRSVVNNIAVTQTLFSATDTTGKPGKPESSWSGNLTLSVLKNLAPEDSPSK